MKVTGVHGVDTLYKYSNIYIAGQPSINAWEDIKDKLQITKVINIRNPYELDFKKQQEQLRQLDISYQNIPTVQDGKLNIENHHRLSRLINGEDIYFIHCGTANRVAVWLMFYLYFYQNFNLEDATTIAKQNGLQVMHFVDQLKDIQYSPRV